jgi:hypothetical protein
MSKNKYLLIDGDSLAYYSMSAETLEEGMQGIDARIKYMLEVTETEKYHLFLSTKSFRHNIATIRPYKGNRKKVDKILLPSLLKHLEVNHNGVRMPLLEADDLVSFFNALDKENSIICSPDKDVLLQNYGKHYNYGKDEFIEVGKDDAQFFLWKQVIMGDSGDNIEGIPGIGPKKAESILNDCNDDYYSKVLFKYIEKFGDSEGVSRFKENFDLVYLLKNNNDMIKRTGTIPSLGDGLELKNEGVESIV